MEWVTSDTHFGHKNTFGENGFCATRAEFSSLEEMEDTIITNWNKAVGKLDTVYHLGDLAFRGTNKQVLALVSKLNGIIVLHEGNHDSANTLRYLEKNSPLLTLPNGTTTKKIVVNQMGTRIKRNGIIYYLTHYPLGLGKFRRKIRNICGHIHEQEAYDPNVINVGVDSPEIEVELFGTPISLEEAMTLVGRKWENYMCKREGLSRELQKWVNKYDILEGQVGSRMAFEIVRDLLVGDYSDKQADTCEQFIVWWHKLQRDEEEA